jgi:hypothetical protein
MKEKLIKELDGADLFLRNRVNAKPAPLNEWDKVTMLDIAKTADEAARMLERAVVPPVKIGQELWDIHYNRPRKWEVVYLGFNGKEWFIHIHWWKDRHNFKTMSITYPFVGKMWYFSKEEAEKTLKGAEGKCMNGLKI